jgi:hypothetical protein
MNLPSASSYLTFFALSLALSGTTFLTESFAASAGEQRPPTPTVALAVTLLAAFSAVQLGSSSPAELSGMYIIATRLIIVFRTDFFVFVFMFASPVMVFMVVMDWSLE